MEPTDPKKKKLLQALQDGKISDANSLALYQILEDASLEVEKMDKIKQEVADKVDEVDTKISEAVTTLTEEAKSKIEEEIAKVETIQGEQGIAGLNGKNGKDGRNGKDGENGQDGKDAESIPGQNGKDGSPDKGEEIIAKINDLPIDEDEFKIDYSHIKNVPKPAPQILGTQGPNALFALSDVDVTGIIVGQAIKWDGVRWIPFTPAGGNTAVYNEVVSGSGTSFTLANTPIASTVRLYAGRNRIYPITDYSISGTGITTVLSWSLGDILADYEK